MPTVYIRCKSCSNEETNSTLEQCKDEFLSNFRCSSCSSKDVEYIQKELIINNEKVFYFNKHTNRGDMISKQSDELKNRFEYLKTRYPNNTIQTK